MNLAAKLLSLQCNQLLGDAMKVSELKRLLKRAGCYELRTNLGGHDEWYSPITDRRFRIPRHQSREIAYGTLENIKKSAGI